MPANIIDGSAIAAKVRVQLKQRVSGLALNGQSVRLSAVLIGSTPAAEMYAQRQQESCKAVGIVYDLITLPHDITEGRVLATIDKLNEDKTVTGVIIQLPVPPHLDSVALQARIVPGKDIEGVNPANLGYLTLSKPVNIPCTALAAFELIKSTGVSIKGKEAVVVGASEIVGKPVALLLSDERATVQICRSATPDLEGHCRNADILVAAVGRAGLITGDHVKQGAVVIDVGINRVTLADGSKKTVGDVDFEAARAKAGWITPVPGGVGPMTVAMLLQNTVNAAEKQTR